MAVLSPACALTVLLLTYTGIFPEMAVLPAVAAPAIVIPSSDSSAIAVMTASPVVSICDEIPELRNPASTSRFRTLTLTVAPAAVPPVEPETAAITVSSLLAACALIKRLCALIVAPAPTAACAIVLEIRTLSVPARVGFVPVDPEAEASTLIKLSLFSADSVTSSVE